MKRALWLRLKQYHFDNLVPPHLWDRVASAFGNTDASTRAFANKLARKLGWHPRFALRAIDEYRKFVYLGVVADFSVTPPKIIDQVWHEHLLFSRAYREFCRDVLQRDFDHSPELVPSDEQIAQYEAQYDATLELYHTEFNVTPPAAFWGTPKFAQDADRRSALKKKEPALMDGAGGGSDGMPLYATFDGRGDAPSHHEMAEFGGGGGFSGGGGGDDWSSPTSQSGNAGGDSSSDSGGSDGGGSSCSSGCGGGGD